MSKKFECNLGAAIVNAAGLLPLDYSIILSVEPSGYSLYLLPPHDDSVITKCDDLVDGIEDLVARAVIIERDRIVNL